MYVAKLSGIITGQSEIKSNSDLIVYPNPATNAFVIRSNDSEVKKMSVDIYDVRGRTAHETIFNVNDGTFRCPNTQQGYSPFSTWMRGLSWALLGFAEQMEFLQELRVSGTITEIPACFQEAALATADFYLANVCHDGVPMWDNGAPGLALLGTLDNDERMGSTRESGATDYRSAFWAIENVRFCPAMSASQAAARAESCGTPMPCS
jgi:hypothetical protein